VCLNIITDFNPGVTPLSLSRVPPWNI
jgi:hypothetical protein